MPFISKALRLSALPILLLFITSCSSKLKIEKPISLDNVPIYTIKGFKDKRIDAMYSLTYVSSNLDKKECHQENVISSSKKPVVGNRIYHVFDENYTVTIPIELTDNTDLCGFKFRGIELIMKRAGESGYNISTHFPILSRDKEADFRRRTSGSDKFSSFETDKRYFRVAPDTSFLCRTEYYEVTNSPSFYCVMQIDSGDTIINPIILNGRETRIGTNSQFGTDSITNSTITINMVVDSSGSTFIGGPKGSGIKQDYFREYIPPKKSFINNLFE